MKNKNLRTIGYLVTAIGASTFSGAALADEIDQVEVISQEQIWDDALKPYQQATDTSACDELPTTQQQSCIDEKQAEFEQLMNQVPPKTELQLGDEPADTLGTTLELDTKQMIKQKDEFRVRMSCVGDFAQCVFDLHQCEDLETNFKQSVDRQEPYSQRKQFVDECFERDEKKDKRAYKRHDDARNLVDGGRTSSFVAELTKMAGKMSATLPESKQPWSDDYWAIYKGVLGYRYGDPGVSIGNDWKEHEEWHFERVPPSRYFGSGRNINYLSPSEKWDALIGLDGADILGSASLTSKMWDEGRQYWGPNDPVETWMGICHGWAPAAYMLPRPVKTITLRTPSGEPIKLYPADIKALGSLLWANGRDTTTRFVGGRCNSKDVKVGADGAIEDDKCFDTNPGTWHMAVVNQIGFNQRSFIIDATFDYEVWNQPVLSYEYTYFNPRTFERSNSLRAAAENLSGGTFTGDKFKGRRNTNSVRGLAPKSVVGVSMTVRYMVETHPTQRTTDAPRFDGIQEVTYVYDLEMSGKNGTGEILGGEWYQNKHPDFLWTPAAGAKIATPSDSSYSSYLLSNIGEGSKIPEAVRTAAAADAKRRLPNGNLLRHIFDLAAGNVAPAPTPDPEPDTTDPVIPDPVIPPSVDLPDYIASSPPRYQERYEFCKRGSVGVKRGRKCISLYKYVFKNYGLSDATDLCVREMELGEAVCQEIRDNENRRRRRFTR